MTLPAGTRETRTPPAFDERLVETLRAAAGDRAESPARVNRRRRVPRRRGLLIAVVAVTLAGAGAAAVGGALPGFSLEDPEAELVLTGERGDPSAPTSVVIDARPDSGFVGSTTFDCKVPDPVAICGSYGASDGRRATHPTRIVVRTTDEVAAVDSDLPGVRATRGGGYMLISISVETLTAARPKVVVLTFRDTAGDVLVERTVPLPQPGF